VGTNGFIRAVPFIPSTRFNASSSSKPISADTILYRRKRAPKRNPENDIYFADRYLDASKDQALPDSDLLKSIHQYASDFYATVPLAEPVQARRKRNEQGELIAGQPRPPRSYDYKSLDGTALIAMGILVEEMARDALGESGHLVFTEPRGGDDSTLEEAWTRDVVGSVSVRNSERSTSRARSSSRAAMANAAVTDEGEDSPESSEPVEGSSQEMESNPSTRRLSLDRRRRSSSEAADEGRSRSKKRIRSMERKRVKPTRTWTLENLRRAKSQDANEGARGQ